MLFMFDGKRIKTILETLLGEEKEEADWLVTGAELRCKYAPSGIMYLVASGESNMDREGEIVACANDTEKDVNILASEEECKSPENNDEDTLQYSI